MKNGKHVLSFRMSCTHAPLSFARETLLLNMQRDALDDDELTTETLSARELALDKELIQLIQVACKADKLSRALDLARLLHHTPSLDSAAKVAGFYHLVGLQEKILRLRDARDAHDRLEELRDARGARNAQFAVVPKARTIIIEKEERRVKAFQDFRPPPAIHRPGLERATATPARRLRQRWRRQPGHAPSQASARR